MKVDFRTIAAILLFACFSASVAQSDKEFNDPFLIKSVKLVFDAIFNSSNLEEAVNSTIDDAWLEHFHICTHSYSTESIRVLSIGSDKILKCDKVTFFDIEVYASHKGIEKIRSTFVHKSRHCHKKDKYAKKLDCLADALMDSLQKVYKHKRELTENKSCIRSELEETVRHLHEVHLQLHKCIVALPLTPVPQSNATQPLAPLHPAFNQTINPQQNITIVSPAHPWSPNLPWNNSYANISQPSWPSPGWNNANSSQPWMPLPPWNNTNANFSQPEEPLGPWNNTNANFSQPWMPLPPWNNTNANFSQPWMPLPPWNNTNANFSQPWSPWNMTNSNVTLSWNGSFPAQELMSSGQNVQENLGEDYLEGNQPEIVHHLKWWQSTWHKIKNVFSFKW